MENLISTPGCWSGLISNAEIPMRSVPAMARMMGRCAVAMALVCFLAPSCTSTGGTESADSHPGRGLYLTCSGSCHSPEPVRNFRRDEWERILPEMSREAKLGEPEAALVRSYVLSHF